MQRKFTKKKGYEIIEFKVLDGTALQGRLYAAAQRGPAIVMCRGFNCVMDMVGLPDVAEAFQAAGITALLFDPRNTGASSGEPRQEIDPFKQVEDLSDALTILASQSSVDSFQFGFWGFSFGGTVSLCAASLDKRAKFVVVTNVLTDFEFEEGKHPKVLGLAVKERESQLRGNPPFSLPIVNDKGENRVGFGHGLDKERYARII